MDKYKYIFKFMKELPTLRFYAIWLLGLLLSAAPFINSIAELIKTVK